MRKKNVFVYDRNRPDRAEELKECRAQYGFSQVQEEAACALARKTGYSLRDCFAFLDDFCVRCYADDKGIIRIWDEGEFKLSVMRSTAIAGLCIRFRLSIEEAIALAEELAAAGMPAHRMDPRIIELYLKGELEFRHFWYAYRWGLKHGLDIDDMEEFLWHAEISGSLEAALSEVRFEEYPDALDPASVLREFEKEELITGHELELQETDFSAYERFDEPIDIDNMGYDDTDDLDY